MVTTARPVLLTLALVACSSRARVSLWCDDGTAPTCPDGSAVAAMPPPCPDDARAGCADGSSPTPRCQDGSEPECEDGSAFTPPYPFCGNDAGIRLLCAEDFRGTQGPATATPTERSGLSTAAVAAIVAVSVALLLAVIGVAAVLGTRKAVPETPDDAVVPDSVDSSLVLSPTLAVVAAGGKTSALAIVHVEIALASRLWHRAEPQCRVLVPEFRSAVRQLAEQFDGATGAPSDHGAVVVFEHAFDALRFASALHLAVFASASKTEEFDGLMGTPLDRAYLELLDRQTEEPPAESTQRSMTASQSGLHTRITANGTTTVFPATVGTTDLWNGLRLQIGAHLQVRL